MHGYSPEKLLGKNLSIFHTPKQMPPVKEANQQTKETGSFKGEIWHVRRDGTEFPTLMNNSLIKDNNGQAIGMIGTLRDISDMKKAEEALWESEAKYRNLFENLYDIYYRTDNKGIITNISPSVEGYFGYTRDEVIGRYMKDFYIEPKEREDFLGLIMKDGHVNNFEARMRRKDGSIIWLSTNSKILKDADGHFTGVEGITRDVTELKRMEDEKNILEAQLRQAQKLESIGTLAGGIAHDFNNILSIIVGNTELAIDDVPEWHPANQNLTEIKQASLRARDLVKQILSFGRRSVEGKKTIHMSQLIAESLKLLRSSIPTTIEIRSNLSAGTDTIMADPSQINQVLINLCSNAAYAMREKGGVLEVSLDNIRIDKKKVSIYHASPPGNYLRLLVSDTGSGMAPEIVERIFDPYFTTKGVDEGNGIGLAVVHGIVASHAGVITASSEQGKGSSFQVLFPVTAMEVLPEVKTLINVPRGTERILLVDDEQQIVQTVKQMLERLGYQADARISNPEALEVFRKNPEAFDLVITDYTMPNMTGRDLAKKIMAIRPDIPIILCTGFSEQIDENQAKEMGIRAFVIKPIIMSEIARVIREVLEPGTLSGE